MAKPNALERYRSLIKLKLMIFLAIAFALILVGVYYLATSPR